MLGRKGGRGEPGGGGHHGRGGRFYTVISGGKGPLGAGVVDWKTNSWRGASGGPAGEVEIA